MRFSQFSSHIGNDFDSLGDLLGSLGLSWGSLGLLAALLELSWGTLGSSWGSLEPPSASLAGILALNGGLGGLQGSFLIEFCVYISDVLC